MLMVIVLAQVIGHVFITSLVFLEHEDFRIKCLCCICSNKSDDCKSRGIKYNNMLVMLVRPFLSRSMSRLVLCSFLFQILASAQDLGVPLTWREFSNSRLLAERISIAEDAINTILPQLDTSDAQLNGIGYWQSGNVFSAMANFDHLVGTTTYETQVVNGLSTAFNLYSNFDQFGYAIYNDDAMWWATAAYYGYRAYGDENLLSMAIATWNHVSQYVITTTDAATGVQPNKDFEIAGTCFDESMAGGVFWRPTVDDTSINSITTGLFMTLSAFLAETTGDATYTNAAILSAQWSQNLQINADGIVLDTVDGADCTRSPATWLFTYNSGKYLEGLSILKDVTADSAWTSLMTDIAAAAIKSSVWEGSNGIITEGSSPTANNDGVGFKAIFIRGLDEVSVRSSDNSALQILIHSYNDVQYNALLELAANGTSYSSSWPGPPQEFTTWGQLAALDVMVTAINTNSP
ncbi:endo-1,6-alpha-mannosidase [Lentinula aciculospora]|uniref:Endo-1,6-alpha-mannosidase n=1 Tax=Lentinula aciculospora TaxID=153920 RepID=A0A9W9AGU8_9AGAR|nr:endo-1,6-alpha-mannosidase [Lentinula aciculospora]